MDASLPQSNILPSISSFSESRSMDRTRYQPPPLVNPFASKPFSPANDRPSSFAAHPAPPPPPPSYPPSASASKLQSPIDSRRPSSPRPDRSVMGHDNETPSRHGSPRPARQSLPSLHEALKESKALSPSLSTVPYSQSPAQAERPSPTKLRDTYSYSTNYGADGPSPNSYHHHPQHHHHHSQPQYGPVPPPPLHNPTDLQHHHHHHQVPPPPLRQPTSPRHQPTHLPPSYSTYPSQYNYSTSSASYGAPAGYAAHAPRSMPPPAPSSPPPSAASPPHYASHFPASDALGSRQRTSSASEHSPQKYGEAVKRHIEAYDIEQGLLEIIRGSSALNEFGGQWSRKIHHSPRIAPLTTDLPDLREIEQMFVQTDMIHNSLSRLRTFVIEQQNAVAEQNKEKALLAARQGAQSAASAADDKANSVAIPVGETKKRRGRAAPPGRCHSCNRAETPEWRRGPDGARTLCNACGLHYAKLTRKAGVNKNSSSAAAFSSRGSHASTSAL